MQRISLKLFLTLGLLSPFCAGAVSPVAADSSPSYNFPLIALVSLVVILTLANALLAIVLKQLALAFWDKQKAKNATGNAIKPLLMLLILLIPASQSFAQDTIAVPEKIYISGVSNTDFYFLIGMISFMMLIMFVLLGLIQMFARALRNVPEKAHIPKAVFKRNFLDVFNKSVAIEKEKDILLDHNYDGIHELDNDLPPWWKYGFILTIIVAFIYAGYYHAAGGPSQVDEYNAAVTQGEIEKAEYLARSANNVDENTVTMVLDKSELSLAEGIFQTTCAACHLKDGGGSVGPNLTDDYWMHGGSIKDVFKTIKYGWPDKGMKSWKDDYSPKQIAALSSYIKTLKGTKPLTPKAPQGDLFVEGGDKAIDSISNKTDPSLEPSGEKEHKNNALGNYKATDKQ